MLSIHPPWAWAIIFAGKDVENRSWETPYRGRILIHASARKYSAAVLQEVREEIAALTGVSLARIPEEFPASQILGSVELADCVQRHKSPWAFRGQVHWVLRRPRKLKRPVRDLNGKLGLWKWTR